jgi:hypothetical protein
VTILAICSKRDLLSEITDSRGYYFDSTRWHDDGVIKSLKAIGFNSNLSYLLGFISVAGSIAVWNSKKGKDDAHAERFGIFVGLWAPTFFAIGNGLDAAERLSIK